MKHLFLIAIFSFLSVGAQAGPTCAEYFKHTAQGTDWPYALPMSDFANQCKMSPGKKACPLPQNHFAIVMEHANGTNNTVFCKLSIIEANNELNDFNVKTRHIDCTNISIEINSIVLITDSYYEMIDKLGRKSCFNTTSLIKVIGKPSY